MKSITIKRTKAYFIDLAISTAVIGVAEYFLRKKVKNEAVHALVTPSVVMSTLECAQLLRSGQTVGYKKMGLVLESETGTDLSAGQLMKRIFYRDTFNSFLFIGNRRKFEKNDGKTLPHDFYAGTIVKEV
ncbi:RDD family protein [Sporosarcina gallistercoris]|uniref:RDD family protein n=1 Tax=Sporosarcina gallistercoris TaxID=2762245 RepID=A0ABR8PIJ7_9BACL|nr:RDD family protein [Sporosarcina gallistercoris]MBD7908012.1 RDD family protein [Sporosarcina gallistercoris]